MIGSTQEDSPATEAAAGVVTLVTLVVAFGLLAVGWPYFWIAFPVGFGGLLPAAMTPVASRRGTASASVPDRRSGGTVDTAGLRGCGAHAVAGSSGPATALSYKASYTRPAQDRTCHARGTRRSYRVCARTFST
jgi:hypothetical protein